MSFLKSYKAAVALVAVVALIGGAAHFSGMTCCTGTCALTSLLSVSTAYAGPGCNSSSKASGVSSTCSADSKEKVMSASAVSADGKTCTKEQCVAAIMAEKKITRAEAEVVYANAMASGSCHGEAKTANATAVNATESGCASTKVNAQTASASGCASKASAQTASASGCASKASAQTASASGCASKASAQTASASGCTGHANATATLASATEGKTCDKEACIAKCMTEKGYTRAQAEECWAKCQAGKSEATQATVMTASATENTGTTREAWINAKVASGLTQAEAEVACAKAVAAGEVTFVSATQVNASGCAASKASATGTSSCCAAKAKAATAEVKTESTTPAATTTTTATTGGNK